MSLQQKQAQIVAAVKEWNRLAEEGDWSAERLSAYQRACVLVRDHPDAAVYLLSIWYEPDAAEEPR